jgi:hypothetical protein
MASRVKSARGGRLDCCESCRLLRWNKDLEISPMETSLTALDHPLKPKVSFASLKMLDPST